MLRAFIIVYAVSLANWLLVIAIERTFRLPPIDDEPERVDSRQRVARHRA